MRSTLPGSVYLILIELFQIGLWGCVMKVGAIFFFVIYGHQTLVVERRDSDDGEWGGKGGEL